MKTASYSYTKDCCGTILIAVGVLGLLYLLYWLLPLGIFGVHFWTGMAMPVRTEAEYQTAVQGHWWPAFFWRFLPLVSTCVGFVWFGRRLRRSQQRLLETPL